MTKKKILIADSGSTKTDWVLIDANGTVQSMQSIGLNPDFHTHSSIQKEIREIADYLKHIPSEIHFYGSGASSPTRQAPLLSAINNYFPDTKASVSHDLLGAARATLGNQSGLVGILGTGSNCCAYDGKAIVKEFRSGGYILSDEGGGVFMGKMLLKAFIEDELESDLRDAFIEEYGLDVDTILHHIYKEKMPNRFIASFSSFIGQNRTHAQIKELIEQSFDAFFEQKVCRFEGHQDLPLGVVGSIANHFEKELSEAAKRFRLELTKIEAKPIEALARYHQTMLG